MNKNTKLCTVHLIPIRVPQLRCYFYLRVRREASKPRSLIPACPPSTSYPTHTRKAWRLPCYHFLYQPTTVQAKLASENWTWTNIIHQELPQQINNLFNSRSLCWWTQHLVLLIRHLVHYKLKLFYLVWFLSSKNKCGVKCCMSNTVCSAASCSETAWIWKS